MTSGANNYGKDHVEFLQFSVTTAMRDRFDTPVNVLGCAIQLFLLRAAHWSNSDSYKRECFQRAQLLRIRQYKLLYRLWRRQVHGWPRHMHRRKSKKAINNAQLRVTCAYGKIPALRTMAMIVRKRNYLRNQSEVKPPPLPLP